MWLFASLGITFTAVGWWSMVPIWCTPQFSTICRQNLTVLASQPGHASVAGHVGIVLHGWLLLWWSLAASEFFFKFPTAPISYLPHPHDGPCSCEFQKGKGLPRNQVHGTPYRSSLISSQDGPIRAYEAGLLQGRVPWYTQAAHHIRQIPDPFLVGEHSH